MSEKFREYANKKESEAIDDKNNKESKRDRISRRNFLKGISAGFVGTAINFSEQENTLAADGINRAEWSMQFGAISMEDWMSRRKDPLPNSVSKYLINFEERLKQKEIDTDDFNRKVSDLKRLCLAINKRTLLEGNNRALTPSIFEKSTVELVADLSDWAIDREARLYVKKQIVNPTYVKAAAKYLEKKDFESARNIIENIILKNLADATKKQNVDSSIANIRNSFTHYGEGFLIPSKDYAGNLKIWAYISESLNAESDYWRDILGKIKK